VRYVRLCPLDTLFFRDGSPFTAGETGQMEVRGVFPPSPMTVVGALRAAFARELGWTGGPWGQAQKDALGNGDALGSLRFYGPYLAKDGQPLFPAPLHLLEAKGKEGAKDTLTFLKPSDKELTSDLGQVRLPEPQDRETKGFKPLEDAYLKPEAMQAVLKGELPDAKGIVRSKELWQNEARVGIRRDDESRTTKEDALYQTAHVRLARGVSLVMGVEGYDGNIPGLATLGGESRMVGLEDIPGFKLPEAPSVSNRYTVTLLTPGRFKDDGWKEPGGKLADLPGTVVSACVGKPVMIGGWDSEAKKPKKLTPHLPAGSVWFMEASSGDLETVAKMHGKHIGEKSEWGYGQILIGAW
jgi:CRISPR-associated protein Cmr3